MEKEVTKYRIKEYLELEAQATIKNEYHNGLIIAMSGGTLNHGIIGNNINTEINSILKSKNLDCVSINSDVKIFIEKANSFVYPDGMVICGKIETATQDANAIINPILIIEVLSNSTERYDRGGKFHKYCSLPSFAEYILIDQYQPVIDSLYRFDNKSWNMMTTIGLDKSIHLQSIDAHILVKDIYRNVIDLNSPQFVLDF